MIVEAGVSPPTKAEDEMKTKTTWSLAFAAILLTAMCSPTNVGVQLPSIGSMVPD